MAEVLFVLSIRLLGESHGLRHFTHFHSICIWERSFLAYLRVGLFIFDKLRLYKLGSHTGK